MTNSLFPMKIGITGSSGMIGSRFIKKYDSIYGPRIKPLITCDPTLNIDNDEKFDFFISEMILNYWNSFVIPK